MIHNCLLTVDCPMGTYSVSGRCLLCEKGTYQDEIGQTVCKLCPTDKTTEFVGSQDVSNCTGLFHFKMIYTIF